MYSKVNVKSVSYVKALEGNNKKSEREDEENVNDEPMGKSYEFVSEGIDWACNGVMVRIQNRVRVFLFNKL